MTFLRLVQHALHLNWYINRSSQVPLSSDLTQYLPLPDLAAVRILWPSRYSHPSGLFCLEMIKDALRRFVPVETRDICPNDRTWHNRGGFPVPRDKADLIGTRCNPKSTHGICGDIFEVQRANQKIRCAYDYSDYPVVSTEIAQQVDLYFKCVSPNAVPGNVIPVGYFPSRPRLLAKARLKVLQRNPVRNIDVYGRFGAWTDSQPAREQLVTRMRQSSLRFRGGLHTAVFPAYLKDLMSAKIALEAPGQGPITHRLPEAMALGAVIVAAPPACTLPEPLADGIHYIATREDGSDVVEKCEDLLRDETRLTSVASNAMGFFDRNFSPQSIARRILCHALSPTNW